MALMAAVGVVVLDIAVSTAWTPIELLFDVESGHSTSDVAPRNAIPLATSGPGGALFFTQRDDAMVTVDLEVWDGEPTEPEDGVFEDSFEGTFTNVTGRAVLGSITASPSDRTVELPPRDTYHLRAYRSATVDAPPDPDDDPEIELTMRRWLLQVW